MVARRWRGGAGGQNAGNGAGVRRVDPSLLCTDGGASDGDGDGAACAGLHDGDSASAGGSFSSRDSDAGVGGGDTSLPPVLGMCATPFVFVV
jgi:hypothetical protein